jgi:hypothetical protein
MPGPATRAKASATSGRFFRAEIAPTTANHRRSSSRPHVTRRAAMSSVPAARVTGSWATGKRDRPDHTEDLRTVTVVDRRMLARVIVARFAH